MGIAPPAARAESAAAAARESAPFQAIVLDADGRVGAAALDALTASLRPQVDAGRTQIVVLVHGFNTPEKKAWADYGAVASRLREQARQAGLSVAVVGVEWASDAGPVEGWLPQAIGHRVTSLLGFHRAVRNPYLEKVRLARRSGRSGLRATLFRLEDAFPGVPIHLLSHSLGAELAVSALSPDGVDCPGEGAEIDQPQRVMHLGVVALAGADLDQDVFARRSAPVVRQALRRAQVWWVTVPEKDQADGVLELRRGARSGDAVGNRGLRLTREDLAMLVEHRALVLDQGRVPASHELIDYYRDNRLKELAASMLYLSEPAAPAAQRSVLAALDAVLKADVRSLPQGSGNAGTRLYVEWRSHPKERDFGPVTVADRVTPDAGDAGHRHARSGGAVAER